MKKNLLLTVLIFLLGSCSSKNHEIPIIDPGYIVNRTIFISEIATEIDYIPLSNEILFGGLVSIELTDSLIFITPINEGLLVYDLNGNYRRQIGKRGRGPGEYRSATKFTLDKKNEIVYVLELTKNRLLKYSYRAKFLGITNLKTEGQSFFSEIIFSNNNLFLFEGINQGYGKYDWVVWDTLGNILSEKFNSIEKFPSYNYCCGNKQEAFNNTFYYWNQINDTIFEIKEDKYEPAFLFAQGDFRFPKKKIKAVYDEYFFPRVIFFSKHYLFIAYIYDYKSYTGIYVKSENQFYNVNVTEDWNFVNGPGIINNFDSGLPLIPLSYYCNNKNEEFLIGEISPFELKTQVASNAFKNSTPKYPEKKKELEKLANSLDENDNPLLMLVKLKD